MLTSLLWVVFVVGVVGVADDSTDFIHQIGQTAKAVQDLQPPAVETAPEAIPEVPVAKDTRSKEYESSPGPVIKLEAGRTPAAVE